MKERLPSHRTCHDKPQLYRHKYCLVCMTGMIGCRWHRYQQSTRDSRKRDLLLFSTILLSFLHVIVFFYLWLINRNNTYCVTVAMYQHTRAYYPWNDVGLAVSSIMLAYYTGLVILCLLHVQFGHQLYIHPFHLGILFLMEMTCIIVSVLVDVYWPHSWPLVLLSLRVYGPFLQVAAVVLMTAMAWLIIRQWFRLTFVFRIVWLPVMLLIMLFLYLLPLWISSPLIGASTTVRPEIIAIGGASDVAPETTMFAFRRSLQLGVTRVQATVQISFDGVPFLLHDESLIRTTDFDVERDVNMSEVASLNTISDLHTLSTGSWFIEHDPWGTAWRLSENETHQVKAQKIPTLADLLQLGATYSSLEVYLLVRPPPDSHPHSHNLASIIDQVISESQEAINTSHVYVPSWLYQNGTDRESYMPATGRGEVSTLYMGVDSSNLWARLRENTSTDMTTAVTDVNSRWLLSALWCAGADLVATRYIEDLQSLANPMLQVSDNSYIALWVSIDVLSVVAIVVIFIVHRIKIYGTKFSPESISLNAGRTKASYRSRTMKEKLLRECTVVDSMDELEARDNDGLDNQPQEPRCERLRQVCFPSHTAELETVTNMVRDRGTVVSCGELVLPPVTTVSSRFSV